jgi:hypothetical protein
MKNILLFLACCLCITVTATAQKDEKKPPLFGINITGLIKTDFIYDSRQTESLREGSLLFYPLPESLDSQGKDINAKTNFSFLSLQTKLTLNITGPDALGAKTSGMIEAEFFGNVNTNLNVFRMRHAFIRLNWPKTELLVGQFWHPMYEVNCWPEVVSADAGLPFKVYARNPQIRVTQQAGNFRFIAAAMSQMDFTNTGPDGTSPKYLRNSVIPEADLQVQYWKKNEATGNEIQVGVGIDYLVLTPRLATEVITKKAYDTVVNNLVVHHDAVKTTFISDTKIGSLSANAFMKLRVKPITLKIGGIYSQDGQAFSLIGGYTVKSITDSLKNAVDYANVSTAAFWADIATNGKTWQVALFGGFSRNLGAGTKVTGPYYSRGSNIDYLYRIAPRVLLNASKLRFSAELEYTVAAYGTTTNMGYVNNSKEVGNIRFLVGVYYFF